MSASSAPAAVPAAPTADEAERLAALRRAAILDTPPEAAFDRLVRVASQLTGTPIALVSLIDSERQWFKAKVGLAADETPRDWAFCAHAILQPDEVLLVPDAAADARFRGNPLVVGKPDIRFYAGAPIVTRDGHALGTVCAIDSRPRRDIGARETALLQELARIAADEIELRNLARQLDKETRQRARAEEEAARQRASQSLMRLTGGIAHEFNNLFTGLALMAENLQVRQQKSGAPDPTLERPLSMMLEALQRGGRLTNAMLAYSGKQYLDAGALDVRAILENAAAVIPALHGKTMKVEIDCAADCAAVEADGRQLLAALAELAANAVDATAPAAADIRLTAGNVTLSAADAAKLGQECLSEARAGAFVRIAMIDRGRGMTDEVRERACEPFFTTKPVGGGPGLGLSMVAGFARQSGGFVTLFSAPGAGTTAALYLPRA